MCGRKFCQAAAILPLMGLPLMGLPLIGAGPLDAAQPNLQEVEVAGRVLHFQADQPSGPFRLAVVYNPSDPDSRAEAAALMALLGSGLVVGDLILQPVLVAQARLADSGGFGAVFETIGVDDGLLGRALRRFHIPCVTRHLEQVGHGACTVAIRSGSSVSIVLSAANATADGVRFATAFRMMVEEL
jgi:hypothetical protein